MAQLATWRPHLFQYGNRPGYYSKQTIVFANLVLHYKKHTRQCLHPYPCNLSTGPLLSNNGISTQWLSPYLHAYIASTGVYC